MRISSIPVAVVLAVAGVWFTWGGTAFAQIEELPRPATADSASFGVSVALGDSLAAVGASAESVCGANSGAVYVFRRTGGPQFASWRLEARLIPRRCRSNAFFGDNIALSGGRLLVSASSEHFEGEGSNAVIVFERRGSGQWTQTDRLTPVRGQSEGLFAADLDLDGDRAVVSTSGSPETGANGAVYVYDYDGRRAEWTRAARLTVRRNQEGGILGGSVALDGNHIAVSASTYFEREPGAVHVFERHAENGSWHADTVLTGIDGFFIDVDLTDETLLVGESRAGDAGSGRALIYTTHDDGSWGRNAILYPSAPYESGSFGDGVSIEGDWALVSGYDEQLGMEFNIDRVVYVFRRERGEWREYTILDVGEVDFGAAFDQCGSTILASSVPANEAGTVYVIQL